MKIILIDNGTTLLNKLQDLIPGEEVAYHWKDFIEKDASDADLVVLSGGSDVPLVGNEDRFSEHMNLIRNSQLPIIGICLGCEIIVHALGGKLHDLQGSRKGITNIQMRKDFGFLCKGDVTQVYENHKWGIQEVPKDCEVLAESDHGPEIIRHKKRPIFGFQFHPENLTSETLGDEIFLKAMSLLKVR